LHATREETCLRFDLTEFLINGSYQIIHNELFLINDEFLEFITDAIECFEFLERRELQRCGAALKGRLVVIEQLIQVKETLQRALEYKCRFCINIDAH
jgi:hypothetical protein